MLKEKLGDYEAKILSLNKHAIEDLKWWLGAIPNAKNNINTDGSNPTWEFWSENDKNYHINYLELLAIKHAVMIYEDIWKGCKHIKIKSDNTTAISYINNMRGIPSDSCNHSSKTIWYYCINMKVWLLTVHIPSKVNETENTEWRLSPIVSS